MSFIVRPVKGRDRLLPDLGWHDRIPLNAGFLGQQADVPDKKPKNRQSGFHVQQKGARYRTGLRQKG